MTDIKGIENNNGNSSSEKIHILDKYADIDQYILDKKLEDKNYDKPIVLNRIYSILTNAYQSPVTDIVGKREWTNEELNKLDFVEVQLYRQTKNNEKTPVGKPVKLIKEVDEYIWKNQPINDNNGERYIYTVEEITEKKLDNIK